MRSLILALLTCAGCFTVTPADGTLRCSSDPKRLCPGVYVCIAGYCYNPNEDGGDGAVSDGGSTD